MRCPQSWATTIFPFKSGGPSRAIRRSSLRAGKNAPMRSLPASCLGFGGSIGSFSRSSIRRQSQISPGPSSDGVILTSITSNTWSNGIEWPVGNRVAGEFSRYRSAFSGPSISRRRTAPTRRTSMSAAGSPIRFRMYPSSPERSSSASLSLSCRAVRAMSRDATRRFCVSGDGTGTRIRFSSSGVMAGYAPPLLRCNSWVRTQSESSAASKKSRLTAGSSCSRSTANPVEAMAPSSSSRIWAIAPR